MPGPRVPETSSPYSAATDQTPSCQRQITEALCRENYVIYLINVDDDRLTPYWMEGETALEFYHGCFEGRSYSEGLEYYIAHHVHPDNQGLLRSAFSLEKLEAERDVPHYSDSVAFRRTDSHGEVEYLQFRILGLTGCDDDYILAARIVSDSIQESFRQREFLQEALTLSENARAAKSAFLANMSHDFRTPMNTVSGFTSIALAHLDDKERVKDCLEKIALTSHHLLNLINDILDISSIESGKVSINETPTDLRDLLDEQRAMFQEQAAERGIAFSVESIKLNHPAVYADTVRISQIFVNIIGNALKFTSSGGAIEVFLRELPTAPTGYGGYLVTFTDTGCGMSEEFLGRIWDAFERDPSNTAQRVEGTGLGMSITKALVDKMGGSITVESVLGRGSTFKVYLPLRLQDGEARPQTPWTNPEKKDRTVDKRLLRGKRVLLVDDDDLSREIVLETLNDYGLHIDEASNGCEAVEMFAASTPFHYNIVLMDMHMPLLDGDEATRAIRALPRDDVETIPIIATTADAFKEYQDTALAAGMTDVLTKPYSARNLVETITEHIAAPAPAAIG